MSELPRYKSSATDFSERPVWKKRWGMWADFLHWVKSSDRKQIEAALERNWCAEQDLLKAREELAMLDVHREPTSDRDKVETLVYHLLNYVGEDPEREGLQDTPSRVAKMYLDELCVGYTQDPMEHMRVFEAEGAGELVIVRGIPIYSLCEHHLVPFIGKAAIGYVPDQYVLGLSKFARIANVFARRLQIQERLTNQIADTLVEGLRPKGVMVVIEAEHHCMTFRGIQAPGSMTTTSAVRGIFKENDKGVKDEFLRLITA